MSLVVRPPAPGRKAAPPVNSHTARYQDALDCLVTKLKQDRYVLAAIVYGSFAYDEVWEKSDLDILLIGVDEKKATTELALTENGINIHGSLMSRAKFKQMLGGALTGSFTHSWFSRSRLLFSNDPIIAELYEDVGKMGAHDREMQLLNAVCGSCLAALYKAEKWCFVKRDPTYCFVWLLFVVNELAKIEVIAHRGVPGREVIQQALPLNPEFFDAVYTRLIHGPKDLPTVEAALSLVNTYLDDRRLLLFSPLLDFLADAEGVRSMTEIDAHFKKRAQIFSVASACEYLADKGVIQKVATPLRLHEKSRVTVDEMAYYYERE